MSRPRQRLAVAVVAALLIAGCGGDDETTSTSVATGDFDAERAFDDVARQVELGPRPSGSEANAELANLLVEELTAAGVDDVTVQSPDRNVVGLIPGSQPGYMVLGAHFDTKDIPGFVGANDGASGVAVVLELARTLPNPMPGPGVAVALFDAEEARGDAEFSEDGTRGSRQYVEIAADGGGEGVPPLDEIESMVLLDMVGDCDLKIPYEANSDLDLYSSFAAADPEVFSGRTFPIADDHVPFAEQGVTVVDLIDFDFGPGESPGAYWHTTEDTIDKVCPESLDAVGEAALTVLTGVRR